MDIMADSGCVAIHRLTSISSKSDRGAAGFFMMALRS